jgi:putative heme iron utilization protein
MPERQAVLRAVDDPARAQAKRLLRTARFGALATLAPGGWPMATRVALATGIDGAPVFLASDLSGHTGALTADPRCSLLVGEPGKGDPLAHPRLTLFARAERLTREQDAEARRRYLARHPKAGLYADFGDFAFWRLGPERADFNGGFGKAYDLSADDLTPRVDWAALAEAEASAVAHMNEDHRDAVDHFARICGARDTGWTLTGIDPEGVDLVRGDDIRRLDFMTPVRDAAGLRAALVALARREA